MIATKFSSPKLYRVRKALFSPEVFRFRLLQSTIVDPADKGGRPQSLNLDLGRWQKPWKVGVQVLVVGGGG